MTSPLERAARAISDLHGAKLPEDQRERLYRQYEDYNLRVARAVLLAIRAPGDAVIDAGIDMLTERGCNPLSGDAEAVWTVMIDTALGEDER